VGSGYETTYVRTSDSKRHVTSLKKLLNVMILIYDFNAQLMI